ncbi:uncharacterized protein PV09_09180 [Verruconis gallopava]|uniref:Mannosyl-oligosaccharide glucosidase n=1 Tax=Verruconis gallopava TaxID=253628 RepID=A0A0D2AJH5_9PEZI|nr:uncharacterized protein PV09_09180 [Verruconis gallopava]KIV99073.1 hypothetical protein PV09_09180 [Verruconis gallopava]
MILRQSFNGGSFVRLSAFTTLLVIAASALASEPSPSFERASNQSLLWGPYRPNLYFGVRPRIPESLTMGLLWARVEDYVSVQDNFRYTCEQHDGMAGYGWEKYDPRHGGVQTIHDVGNELDLTTYFYKDTSAGDKGGNWGARIKGVPRPGASENLKSTVIFNINMDGQPGVFNNLEIQRDVEEGTSWFLGDVTLKGETPNLGSFKVSITGDRVSGINRHPLHAHPSGQQKSLDRTLVNSKVLTPETLWQSKPLLFALMKQQIDEYIETYGRDNLPPPYQLYTLKPEPGHGNVHFVQKVFEGEFEFDILFSSEASGKELTSAALTAGIESVTKSFDRRFDAIFKPQAPFTADEYYKFSKALFSNLLGGIGYFYGDWKVDRSYSPEYEEENEGFWEEAAEARARAGFSIEGPSELFTSIPSRPFFPRGFLWDEGFHLMPILDWDVELTLQIVKSWFSLMDDDGWIAREQILGPEARSKVPEEFQVQYPHYANPPTLFLILAEFTDKLTNGATKDVTDAEYAPQFLNKDIASAYLRELYPLLKRHYEWFRRTQKGEISAYDRKAANSKEAYRWRGRTERHCLTSGQDDFPRAQPPHPGELHVDALAWVGVMSSSMEKISNFLGMDEDAELFRKHLGDVKANLLQLHWSEKAGIFCDATIDEFEEHVHVCHNGYVTLLPFMVGLLDEVKDAAKIASILEILADPEQLWSDHGIRSLSIADELYGTEENYWRGPVWINLNYLLLKRLYMVGTAKTPNSPRAAELYKELRRNLVSTVYESWKETGFAWEQYNPETGKGQRTQHFTGWTSLIVKVLQMPEEAIRSRPRDEL